ncbi:hypothetical protein ZEAMMB73_Zm00001d049590 [Zea mays]|uniref:Replication protein A DNA-binding subunit B n=2 Tax=Zea mays TaxID=4577 RepID=A0A1D6PWB5_MAIZE|nr:hypothetical protein ZEAMMB73_Zm00001d049590 [Zea mays]
MEFTLIPDLVPQNRHAVIKVYVSRKWIFRGAMDNGPIHHIDLVLIDKEGHGICAEIPRNLAEEKGSIIEENKIYEISRFRISSARLMFKPVHMDKMIHFTYHTIINASLDTPPAFSRYVYHLTPFDQLESYIQKNEYFLDVLGVITQVSALKPVGTHTQESSNVIKEIIIKDINDITMRVTLWAERARAFKLENVYDPLEQKPIVTLFVGCLAKNFQGIYLNGGTACRWYFNPDIREAAPYYQRFESQKIKLHISSEQEQLYVTKETNVEHKTLHELLELHPYAFPKQGYQCTATIIEVPTTSRWWFPACTKCGRACKPQNGGYYCPYCKSEAYILRYKLTFMGSDGTATAQMFCFDTVAQHVVGRSCETVLKQVTEAAPIPPDLAQIVSLKFTFRVTVSNQTFSQREQRPTVLQINSIVAVHGRQRSLPKGIQTIIDQGPSTPNKEATLKLLKESPSTSMERLSTKLLTDVGRKLTYSTQAEDITKSQILDAPQETNADKEVPADKDKEIEPNLRSPPKRHKQEPLIIKDSTEPEHRQE